MSLKGGCIRIETVIYCERQLNWSSVNTPLGHTTTFAYPIPNRNGERESE